MPQSSRYLIPDPSVSLTDELIMRHIDRGSRVIDLGCGDGRLMQRLKQELGCDVLGIEVEHENIVSVIRRGLPAIEADLALLDGGWHDLALQRLTVRGSLPARGDGRIALRADALSQAKSRIASIELALEGRVDSGRFTLATRGIDAPNLPAPTPRAGRTTPPCAAPHPGSRP